MPGFNKKGPQGRGAMTGRRLGNCVADTGSDMFENDISGRRFGRRIGFGFKHGYGSNTNYFSNVSEKTIIENEINTLKDQLNSLEKRLCEWENEN